MVAAGLNPAVPQVMSPRGRDYPPPRERVRTPSQIRGYGNSPYPLEPVDIAIRMVGDFLQVRQGDEEATAARVTYEVNESTAAAVREMQFRQEYEHAVRQLSSELSIQAEQHLHYLEGEQRAYAQARLSTVEAGLATEYMQSQASMQQQYLHQVQEVNAQLYLAEGRYAERIRQQNSAHQGQIEQLRRELREAQELAEVNSMDLRAEKLEFHQQGERHAYLLSSERAQVRKNMAIQAEEWQQHAESISTQATEAIQAVQLERDEGQEEIDQLSQALIHARSELEEWEKWHGATDEWEGWEGENSPPIPDEQPRGAPTTPPVVQSTIPQEFLPPRSVQPFLPKARSAPPAPTSPGEGNSSSYPRDGSSIPTFAPTTPQPLLHPGSGGSMPATPIPATPIPSRAAPGNTWAYTRERMQTPLGTDFQSCPTSAGVSDASTTPIPRPGMPLIPPPGIASPSPSVYACPAMGVTSCPPSPPPPYHQPTGAQGSGGGRSHQDEVRKDRSPIPKLAVKGGDSTFLTRQVNDWLQKTTIALNTWSQAAASFWAQVVGLARQQHNWWLSLSPAQRATYIGLPTTGQSIPLQLPILEATMRAELLNGALPERVTSIAMQKGTTAILDLVFLTFQTFLPSEPSARVDGLSTIEAPLKAAKNFQEALTTLRTWRQQVLTVVTDLGGNPEPLKLLSSLKTLISSLVNSDNAFATEVAQMYRTTNVKVHCTDASLLQMMGLLEIELSSRAQEDDEERRRRGQAHHLSTTSAEASAVNKGKGKSKGKSKTKDEGQKGKPAKGGEKGGDSSKPICTDYLTDTGCPRGDQCTYRHPARVGRCLRCGSTGHQLSTCKRPRRDAKAKPMAKPQPKEKARAKSKARAKPNQRRGANAAWAQGEEMDSTVIIEEVDEEADETLHVAAEYTACSFFTSYLPVYHSASTVTSAHSTEPTDTSPILDSGATHCLLPLSWLSDEDADRARRIHLRVASGAQVRALLFNNIIYAQSVSRPLVSIGQLKTMLDLRFVWDDGPPILLFCSSGCKYILLQARVVHHLPLISTAELTVLLSAINSFTMTGTLWNEKQWAEQLGTQFAIFGGPSRSPYPPSHQDDDQPDEVEAQMMDGNVDDQAITSATPHFVSLEDNDAPTEPEIPILIDAMHAAMTDDQARKVLLDHPLPKARQRTNVLTKDYIHQGRLFGAYTTRGEGVTQATFRFPLAVAAIMCLAATRGSLGTDEGFLSAQVNCATSLPIHQDKNNHSDTWVTAMGDYQGGRLWVESPIGAYPPPNPTEPWHHNLRGDYFDIHNAWVKFSPRCYHAVEQVTSGKRVSLALFSPRSWKKIAPHALSELQDVGFYPPRSAYHISSSPMKKMKCSMEKRPRKMQMTKLNLKN